MKSGADFPAYVQELKAMGLSWYDLYVADGRTVYAGVDGMKIRAEGKYEALKVAAGSDAAKLDRDLKQHQQGGSDYPTFCRDAAAAGVEKWRVDFINLRCTYYSSAGEVMLEEQIPRA